MSSSHTIYPVLINGYWCWNSVASKVAVDGQNPNKGNPSANGVVSATIPTSSDTSISTYDSNGTSTNTKVNKIGVDLKV